MKHEKKILFFLQTKVPFSVLLSLSICKEMKMKKCNYMLMKCSFSSLYSKFFCVGGFCLMLLQAKEQMGKIVDNSCSRNLR